MNPLIKNPETGFLESPSPNFASFDSAKKVRALELAKEMIKRGEYPKQSTIASAVGVYSRTFGYHLQNDPRFKEEWKEVVDMIEDMLVDPMYENGRKPSGYMDRITLLRKLKPEVWNPDRKIQIQTDNAPTKKIFDEFSSIIDAEIVPTSDNLNKSSENTGS